MKKITRIFALAILTNRIFAQDLKGAYILTNWISSNTYSINVTLFADALVNIARPTLTLSFGDNTAATFSLSNTSTLGTTNIKTYTGTHTYPSSGSYLVNFPGVYRIHGIKNMQASQMQPINIGALINISSFTAANNGISISNLPVNLSAVNSPLIYNPGCNAPSGDSLSYSLDNCAGTGYYKANGSSLNTITGQFNFSNDTSGTYAFLITIKQWRKNPNNNQYFQVGNCQIDFTVENTSTVGINEYKQDNSFRVYPNPFTERISLDFDDGALRFGTITILNTLGQVVFEWQQPVPKQEIDISHLPAGIYFLKAGNNHGHSLFKLVKE